MNTPDDQYALDWGTRGRKKARALRLVVQTADYAIYETDMLYLNVYPYRYIMEVPCSISAAGFNMGILLGHDEARRVEAGDWSYFEALAREVQDRPFRYTNVPIEYPSRDSA